MVTTKLAIRASAFALTVMSIAVGWLGRDHLATRVELEVLVAIIALTTFLVGFSTVRLQTRLEEHRASLARHSDRVLEENNRAGMLPLPSEMQSTRNAEDFEALDQVTAATEIFTVFNLALSVLLAFFHWQFYESLPADGRDPKYSYIGYVLILVFHVFVVALGSFASHETNRNTQNDKRNSIFQRYADLEESLTKWLDQQEDATSERDVSRICDRLDEVLPCWVWLTLIRGSLRDPRCDISSLKRIHTSASKEKDNDEYSLIAYVWSAYLKDSIDTNKPTFGASALVRLCELERIAEFAKSSVSTKNQSGWIYASLALKAVQLQVEERGMSVELDQLLEATSRHQISSAN